MNAKRFFSMDWLPFTRTLNMLLVILVLFLIINLILGIRKRKADARRAEEEATLAYMKRRERFLRNTLRMETNL